MELIKDTIKNVMQNLEVKKREYSGDNPEALLKKAFSKKERQHIKFNYFRKGTLSIKVDSSVWLYSLSLKKEDLLTRLKGKSGSIKEIRFRLGETN